MIWSPPQPGAAPSFQSFNFSGLGSEVACSLPHRSFHLFDHVIPMELWLCVPCTAVGAEIAFTVRGWWLSVWAHGHPISLRYPGVPAMPQLFQILCDFEEVGSKEQSSSWSVKTSHFIKKKNVEKKREEERRDWMHHRSRRAPLLSGGSRSHSE